MQILLQVCIMAIYKYSISYISYNDTHKSQNNLFRRCVSELHLHTVNMYNPVYMYMYYRHLIYVSAHYIGYEPAGLTVHPPPQNDRGWVHFFRMGV